MHYKRALLIGALAVGLAAPGAMAADDGMTAKRGAVEGSALEVVTATERPDEIEDLASHVDDVIAGQTQDADASVGATVPDFTTPAQDASVSGVIAVAASSAAPTVRFTSSAGGWTRDVPVVDGVASTTLETWGLNASQSLTARDCDVDGCSGTADSVTFVVSNEPIVLTQPTNGATVGTSVAASVTAAGGGVQILRDGINAGQDATAPYQVTVNTAGLSDGAHTLRAIQCNSDFTQCQGQVSSLVTIDVQNALAPVLRSASPSLISPNGDGRRDTTTLSYELDTPQQVTWRVTNSSGQTVRGPVSLGTRAAGVHEFTFDGKKDSGAYLPTGAYVVKLDTSKTVGDNNLTGSAQRGVVVDRTRPSAGDPSSAPRLFYPARDDFKDTSEFHFRLSEDVVSLRVEVFNPSGKKVRVIESGSRRRGRGAITWNGRTDGGDVVPAGAYAFRLVLRDAAGNQGTTSKAPVRVSDKRLVKKTGSQTVTPKDSYRGAFVGSCSEVYYPAKKAWPGSFSYLSNYHICWDPSDRQLLALTSHSVKVPGARRYGNIKVSTYGARTVPGYPDKGVVLYLNRSGDVTDSGALLSAGQKWHAGDAVDGDDFVSKKHTFRWWAGTTNWWFYDIKAFRVTYAYFVLV